MRILMNHAYQEVGGVFVGGFGGGLPFRHRSQFARRVIHARSPRPQPIDGAIATLRLLRLLLGSDQRILGSGHDGNVGSSDEFEHAQGVCHFFGEPRIARYYGDAQHFRPRRLDQQQDCLLVGAGGSGRVLIDDDLALVLILIVFILSLALGHKTGQQNYTCDRGPL